MLIKKFSGLPSGIRVISKADHGASSWAQMAKIDTQAADGQEQAYILKVNISYHTHSLGNIIHS